MSRKILSWILLLAMVMSCAAFPAAAESGKTVITVWTDTRGDYDYMSQKIKDFNDASQTIEIDYQVMSDNFYQMVEMSFDTETAPDIYGSGQGTATLAFEGKAFPLNELMTKEHREYYGGDESFVEGINMKDGNILSVPCTTSSVRMVYNKDILDAAGIEKAPRTFDELVAAAKQITQKLSDKGIYGFAINLKSPASALGRSLEYMVNYNEGIRQGWNFATGRFEFDKYIREAKALRQIFEDGSAFPGCDQLDIDPLRTQFAAGKIGMYFSWTAAEPGVYAKQFKTDANWDFAPLPSFGDDSPTYSQPQAAGNSYFISSTCKHPAEAFEVLTYLNSPDVRGPWYSQGYGIVMLQSVLSSAVVPPAMAAHPLMATQATDKIWPPAPRGYTLEGENYYSVFAGYILGIPGYEDIEALAADLNDRYNTALEKGIKDGVVTKYTFENFDPANPSGK